MKNLLDDIEDGLGKKLNKRKTLDEFAADTSDQWLIGLWEKLRPFEQISEEDLREYMPKRKSAGQLRPYFPYRIADQRTTFVGDFPVYDSADKEGPDVDLASAALGRHLLYCDTVVLDDPIWWVVCDYVGDKSDFQRLRDRRNVVLRWLDLVRRLRPLLKSQRLVLVPSPPSPPSEAYWHGNAPRDIVLSAQHENDRAFDDQAKELDYLQNEFWIDPKSRRLPKEAWFRTALDEMSMELAVHEFYNNSIDVTPMTGVHVLALDALLEHGEATDAGDPRLPAHMSALRTLGTIPIKDEPGRDVDLLVDLAANDEAFANWREGMTRALDTIAMLDPSDARYKSETHNAFASELAIPTEQIEQARKKATFKGAVRNHVGKITISGVSLAGAVGLAAAMGAGIPAAFGLAGGAVVESGLAFWAVTRGGAARRQGKAVKELRDILSGKRR